MKINDNADSLIRHYGEQFKSRIWRLEHLYKIVNEKGVKVPFILRPSQRNFLSTMWYYNIILKARQPGFTTLIDILGLDMALFTSNFKVNIIADTIDNAEEIFSLKIRDVYNDLPEEIKEAREAKKNDAGHLKLSNGSTVKVTTSARSGTGQFLHVSEFGRICLKYPDKAREIKTGSLPAFHPGAFVFFESTAEGNSGYFFDMCKQAEKEKLMGKKLSKQEFKFHFFPWHEHPDYVLSNEVEIECNPALDSFPDYETKKTVQKIEISDRLLKYFDELSLKHEIELTQEQMNWYALTEKNLGEDMHKEYPSYTDEAFRVSQDGAYYKRQFIDIYKQHRICAVNYESYLPVYTFWDLGVSDDTGIWFAQFIGKEIRLIDYYEQNGEGLPHYAQVLKDRGYRYGDFHYAPHDITVREFSTGVARIDFALELGIKFEAVATGVDLIGGIEQCRTCLSQCYFDEHKCETGLKCLEHYCKEWDAHNGMFKSKPKHDWASHGSDAFRTMAVALGNKQIPFNIGTRQQYPQIATLGNWKV